MNRPIGSRGFYIALISIASVLLFGVLFVVNVKWLFSTGIFKSGFPKIHTLNIRTNYGDMFVDDVYENQSLRADDVIDDHGELVADKYYHRLYWTQQRRPGETLNSYGEVTSQTIQRIKDGTSKTYKFRPLGTMNGIRYYEVDNIYLLWVADNFQRYRYIELSALPHQSVFDTDQDIYNIASYLIRSGQWEWYMTFSHYLLNSHDEYTKKLTVRYASGEFTKNELEQNSTIEKKQVINQAKMLLGYAK